jgi:hypothetical protein
MRQQEIEMPLPQNWVERDSHDHDARFAAAAVVLRLLVQESDIDPDEAHALLEELTGGDVALRARAHYFLDWITQTRDQA